MKNIAVFIFGIILISLFATPIRYEINDSKIYLGSIFDSGFIDFGRLVLYLFLWTLLTYSIRFLNLNVLKGKRFKIFYLRFFSRLIDVSLLTVIVITSMSLFYFLTKSVPLTDFIFLPISAFILWLGYFVFVFKNGRTIGDQLIKLQNLQLKKNPQLFKFSLFVKELAYATPLFLYAITVGLINFHDLNHIGFKDEYIEYTFIFWPILFIFYILFPLTSLSNKDGIGVLEKLTGISAHPKQGE